MHAELMGMGQEVYGPSQFFTLDSVCYSGCQATGAGNCAEICQVRDDRYMGPTDIVMPPPDWPTTVPPGTTVPVNLKQTGQQADPGVIPGVSNNWLLAGAVAVVVLMVARN